MPDDAEKTIGQFIDETIAGHETAIADHEAAIADLRAAKRILGSDPRLRSLVSDAMIRPEPTVAPAANGRARLDDAGPKIPTGEFTGTIIRDVAATILGEHPDEALHFREIARIAMERGYRGKSGDPEQIPYSFYAVLRKYPEFLRTGPTFRWSTPEVP
jgi:antitoxin (DNA-binding transcriptional repressor) of toxin-antitoxin stability system